jgi:hypothetical protein
MPNTSEEDADASNLFTMTSIRIDRSKEVLQFDVCLFHYFDALCACERPA